MLFLSGVCAILALLVIFQKTIPVQRRRALFLIELGAMILLMSDRFAYIYRGNPSQLGFYMVRISNFLVFFMSIFVLYAFNLYLIDVYKNEGGGDQVPRRLQLAQSYSYVGIVLIVISQFTGFYYTFDEQNFYHRSSGFFVCYFIPFAILILQLSLTIENRKRISHRVFFSLLLFTTLPVFATFIQMFAYGISLTNITLVGNAVLLYIFVIFEMNRKVERATLREIEVLKEEQRHIHLMFLQTAEALVSAIDAYTHGHSKRVADYSLKIAQLAGKSEKECGDIYFAALLHDVGKIGIPDRIINKKERLTKDEEEEVKIHPLIGKQILSNISQSESIRIGATYHHERYDGKGYPEGLSGKDIPEIARIIAVADSYDAMTSRRSYRAPLAQKVARAEIEKGIGTQFDPDFARIMLQLIDDDVDYKMQERRSAH